MKEIVITVIRDKACEDLYTTFFNVMTAGKDKEGGDISGLGKEFNPAMPKQDASKFCLEAAETINKLCCECVEQLMPTSFSRTALLRDTDIGKGNTTI